MAHYAFLDSNNMVVEVITGVEEGSDGQDWEVKYGKEEAILIASEEWGMSTYQVEIRVKEWDNRLWQ